MTLRLIPVLHRATHAVALLLAQSEELDVTQAEAHVLAHLHDHGDASIAQIHREFGHRRSTLTSVLDRLAGRQLVTRAPAADDRRSIVVHLTPKGRRLAERVHAVLDAFEHDVARGVPAGDVAAFARVAAAISTEASAAIARARTTGQRRE